MVSEYFQNGNQENTKMVFYCLLLLRVGIVNMRCDNIIQDVWIGVFFDTASVPFSSFYVSKYISGFTTGIRDEPALLVCYGLFE